MKTALKVLIGLVLFVAAGVLVTRLYLADKLDSYVRDSIVQGGETSLQTGFSIDSVSIRLSKGSAELKGIEIENPKGYSDRPVLKVASILLDFDLSTVNDDVLVIEKVTIRDPLVNYEINDQGVANLDVLEKRIAGKQAPGHSSRIDRRLILERLDFRGGTISASTLRDPGKELVFDFPVVFMNDLGSPDGATAEQLGHEVSEVLVERVMSAAKKAGVDSLVEKQKRRLLEKAGEKLEEKLGELIDRDKDG